MSQEDQHKVSNGGINLYKGDCLEIMDRLIEQGVVLDAII